MKSNIKNIYAELPVHSLMASKKVFFIFRPNQRTNGPLNAHLISGPSISTKHTKL